MVQTYGTTDHSPHPQQVHDAGNGEGSALLGEYATPKKPLRDGHAGLTSSIGNLANTIIGSGACFNCSNKPTLQIFELS